MDLLDELESESIYVIREAHARHARLALLWSMGKDSTALLWMCRKAFLGRVPFPVIHVDTGYKFSEMYAFRDRIAAEWGLDLVVRRNDNAIAAGMSPANPGGTFACCNALKTQALAAAVCEMKLDAVLLGIRRDEHGVRAKERYFSPRNAEGRWDVAHQPAELWDVYQSSDADGARHVRVHSLLHMTELDVWRYTKRENIPVVDLYFSGDSHTRFRSLGCTGCCSPVESRADSIDAVIDELSGATTPERAGRAQDKESAYLMQKLRTLGYM